MWRVLRLGISGRIARQSAVLAALCMLFAVRVVARGRTLFLLAGTPTVDMMSAYPVNLYVVGSGRKLILAREIVPAKAGLYSVLSGSSHAMYVLYPHTSPDMVAVIHKSNPTLDDTLAVDPHHLAVDNTALGAGVGTRGGSYLLLPLLRRGSGSQVSVSLLTVAAEGSSGGHRTAANEWSRYRSFRYQGSPGGPAGPGFVPLAYIKNGRVYVQVSPRGRPFAGAPPQQQMALAPSPPSLPLNERAGIFYLVVSSGRFLAIASTPGHSELYVFDRTKKTWSDIRSDATIPYERRIFGPWLATIVEEWRPQGNASNPGREDERNWGSRVLPNVKEGYAFWQGRNAFIPGVLTIDNLVDGRRITIHTGQEDSEILDVRKDGLVLYRVNDKIFSAKIEGDKLGPSKLVVEGEGVPEIHWAFWSNAQPISAEPAPRSPKKKPPITLRLETPRAPLKAGQPAVLLVTTTNTWNRPLNVPLTAGSNSADQIYQIHILDLRGRSLSPLPKGNRIWVGDIGGTELKPRQSVKDRVNVSFTYDLSRPGKYKIWLAAPYYHGPHRPLGLVRSNVVTVTVVK